MASLSSGTIGLNSSVHQVLELPTSPHTKYIIVGDIHGCFDEFIDLLEKVEYDKHNDVVVLCGDLVNKGPKSIEVIDHAMAIGAYAMKGNHDEASIKAYHARRKAKDSSTLPSSAPASSKNKRNKKNRNKKIGEQGGANGVVDHSVGTEEDSKYLQQKWAWVDQLSEAQIQWLESLPYSISMPFLSPPVLCVHAGIVPGVPLYEQELSNLTHMRNLVPVNRGDGDCASQPQVWKAVENADQGEGWATIYQGPEHIYFGHDAKRRLQQTCFATGLDTGCCYGGQLSAVVLPSRLLYQVQALENYALL